jgi:hypothetical protein
MKNILKTTIFAFLLITLCSCTNDKSPVAIAKGFNLRDVSMVTPPAVLLQTNSADVYDKLEWDRADYGVPTQPKYSIVVSDHDSDPTFQNYIEYNGAGIDPENDARKASLTVGEFNNLLNQLPTHNCGIMNIDIRIKSVLGNGSNSQIQYSNPITTSVTSYSTALPMLAFVKNATNPALAPKMLASTSTTFSDYEGYMYLEAGDYKFYRPDGCGSFDTPIVYGGSGSGKTLIVDGSGINITTAGHYFVTADLTSGGLNYDAKPFTAFGVFGPATRAVGFANIVPMVDDNNSNVWKVTMDLFKGKKLGFKSKNWTGNPIPTVNPSTPYATVPDSNPTISFLGGGVTTNSLIGFLTGTSNITVPGAIADVPKQKFNITIDVSKPRNYTYKLELVE